MDKKYTVYRYVGPTGKSYIGCTCQPLDLRANNGNGYKKCPLFYEDILKYGWDCFKESRCILEDNLEHDEALSREKYYIKEYNSSDPKYGYNISTRRGVINLDTGEIFETYREAAKKYNVSYRCIASCCNGTQGNGWKSNTIAGYHWAWIDSDDAIKKMNGEELSFDDRMSTNTSGQTGVCWDNIHKKWISRITIDGKSIRLGGFDTKEEAIKVRLDAENGIIREHRIRSDNTSGVKGVSFDKSRNKWLVQLIVDGKKVVHKRFDLFEDALNYRKQMEVYYGVAEGSPNA